jgi:hypothetical protein
MSLYDSGRDAILEISAAKMRDAILRLARNSAAGACLVPPGGQTIAAWPIDATLRQEEPTGALITITAVTSNLGVQTIDQPLSRFRQQLPRSLPLLGFLNASSLRSDMRVVDGSALAIGYDLDIGDPPNDDLWRGFRRNFLTRRGQAYDWSLALSAASGGRFLDTQLRRLRRRINQEQAGFLRVNVLRATWANPIRITAAGEITLEGRTFGFEVVIKGTFYVEHGRLNFRDDMLHFLLEPEVPTLSGRFSSYIRRALGDEGLKAAVSQYIAADDLFPPVALAFDLPGIGRLRGREVALGRSGLKLVGWLDIIVPPAPALFLNHSQLTFFESPTTACSGGPPAFTEQVVRLNNFSRGRLWLCNLSLQGHPGFKLRVANGAGFQASSNGRRLQNLPASLDSNQTLELILTFQGERDTPAAGTLRLLSNDPAAMSREIPLQLISGGDIAYQVIPPAPGPLRIQVANTPTGQSQQRLNDCREVVVVRDPARLQPPAGVIQLLNTGTTPIYICDITLRDNADIFAVDPVADPLIAPGSAAEIGVRFFPRRVDELYRTVIDIWLNYRTVILEIEARVIPEIQRRRADLAVDGGLLDFIVDLAGDRLCLPAQADICKARPFFEPITGPDRPRIERLTVTGAAADVEILLSDGQGKSLVREFSGDERRQIISLFLPPEGPDGFRGNPCIASFHGLQPGELPLLRMQLAGFVLQPGHSLTPADRVTGVVAADGWVYLATERGIQVIDWRVPANPRQEALVPVSGLSQIAWHQNALYAATADELLVLDLKRPAKPLVQARARLTAPATALAIQGANVYLADGHQLHSMQRATDSLKTLDRQTIPDGAHSMVCAGNTVYVAGQKTLSVIAPADKGRITRGQSISCRQPVQRVSREGQEVVVHYQDGAELFTVDGRGSLCKVAEYYQPYWSRDYIFDEKLPFLYRLGRKGNVHVWEMAGHRLDRAQFKGMLRLHYRPGAASLAETVPSMKVVAMPDE